MRGALIQQTRIGAPRWRAERVAAINEALTSPAAAESARGSSRR